MLQYMMQIFDRKLLRNPPPTLRVLGLMVAILLYGTTGYLYFELPANPDLNWFDAFWYTLVTMTTVGYGDFFPKSLGGRFLVGGPIMIFGIGLLGYALSLIAAALITSKTKEIKGMSTFKFKEHLIVFNYAGLAKIIRVLDELAIDPSVGEMPVILVDEFLDELPEELQRKGVHYIKGNPTRDQTLSRANIDFAKHAIVLTRNSNDPASDHLNVSIALAVEGRNRAVNSVVECIDPSFEELLRKAGSDRIVCSSRFDAHFLSQELLNPGIQEVLGQLLTLTRGQQFYLIPASNNANFSEFANRGQRQGHIVLGICDLQNQILLNPPAEQSVLAGDRVITIGANRLEKL
ncbi:hypothetical protein COW36_07500 [bacterium (Candidatus Blackallbacteria) CG17_big_fil_post_rev_8_21_14_2_50_48_46]|uniref:RCK N-terminal domain-containing protein n=1 Tax=bacterium (Candidatus Blackallbacteria) CG17_big_fil_post_rev_8_21_14_2_50_48_46 TaxID=2014261 RepID=A0A2M7G6W1_9BACT|nr:MAG: hypothetical protein COW64_16600 [bacterium (Candidatus Blackallbacteria) CG18_big_fil_WC_8_21_14_2_50_49_26]PIW17781.1 MAG: hypothetical protein COW36_07500 [bacterium (Candidatus Blackallbacteria) CG17_big_fil_post_rev_8_21_14_2_50_48_46]PIW47340.1 MAG: hypothetical protein COW20_13025 [bacterium (Candidatus Blackallbacteria) CG13_big_fil_rev_8_21_14_2_50_49_14]